MRDFDCRTAFASVTTVLDRSGEENGKKGSAPVVRQSSHHACSDARALDPHAKDPIDGLAHHAVGVKVTVILCELG